MNIIHRVFSDIRLIGDMMIFFPALIFIGRNTLIEMVERALMDAGYSYQPMFEILSDMKDKQ
jgi:hypothetical protein